MDLNATPKLTKTVSLKKVWIFISSMIMVLIMSRHFLLYTVSTLERNTYMVAHAGSYRELVLEIDICTRISVLLWGTANKLTLSHGFTWKDDLSVHAPLSSGYTMRCLSVHSRTLLVWMGALRTSAVYRCVLVGWAAWKLWCGSVVFHPLIWRAKQQLVLTAD